MKHLYVIKENGSTIYLSKANGIKSLSDDGVTTVFWSELKDCSMDYTEEQNFMHLGRNDSFFALQKKMSNAKLTSHKTETDSYGEEVEKVETCSEEIEDDCHGCYYWKADSRCHKIGDPEEIAKQCENNKSIYKLCAPGSTQTRI